VRSITVSMSVCLLSYLTNHTTEFQKNFCTFVVTVARSSSHNNAMLCTSCFVDDVIFHLMEGTGLNQRWHKRTACFIEFAGRRHKSRCQNVVVVLSMPRGGTEGEVCCRRLYLFCIMTSIHYMSDS